MNRDCGPAAQFDSPLLVQNITVAFKTKSQSGSSEDDNAMLYLSNEQHLELAEERLEKLISPGYQENK